MQAIFHYHSTLIQNKPSAFFTLYPTVCPEDKPEAECLIDPCQYAACELHPKANCRADYCGGCNARFYDESGIEVRCTTGMCKRSMSVHCI